LTLLANPKKHVKWSEDLTAPDPTGQPDAPGRENQ
jgi:hypothetical protein